MPTRSAQPVSNVSREVVTVAVTTCKRLDLFVTTIESFRRRCTDQERIAEWICIDDNSSEHDRRQMAERFPFFRFVLKTAERKGQAGSMNLIFDHVRTRFVLYLEDDWNFTRTFRIGTLLELLSDGRCQQVVLCPRPGGLPSGTTSDGLPIEEYLYNPDHPMKPEANRRYDEIYPARCAGGEAGWWSPGFTLDPAICDVEFLRSQVGRFDERIHPRLFEYDYARRAYDAGAKTLSVDCVVAHIGAVSAYDLNDQPQWPWQAAAATTSSNAWRVAARAAQPAGDSAESYKIPNLVHFLYVDTAAGFGLCEMLAILSAFVVQKPDVIFLHYNHEPVARRWWDAARRYVTLVPHRLPAVLHGAPLRERQCQADVLRLQILSEQGGICLGTDVLTLKPYNPLRTHACVVGTESCGDDRDGPQGDSLERRGTISDAVLMAQPNHPYVTRLLEEMARHTTAAEWHESTARLRFELAMTHRDLVHVEPAESFIPVDVGSDELFRDVDQKTLEDILAHKLSDAYCVYLWGNVWHERFLQPVDESYLLIRNNVFARFFRGYLGYLSYRHSGGRDPINASDSGEPTS